MEETTIISSQHNECLDWSLEQIDQSIVAHSYDMARSILEIGKALKAIEDGKKYTEKGYSSFKEYMEDASAHTFEFKYTQARKHIRVYERFGGRLDKLNCAKIEVLDVLRDIPEEDFEKLNDSGELNAMSKREAEELKAKLEAANEQICLLTAENDKIAVEKEKITADCNSFKAERDEYYDQMKELESRPVETIIKEPSEEQLNAIADKVYKETEEKVYKEAEEKLGKAKDILQKYIYCNACEGDGLMVPTKLAFSDVVVLRGESSNAPLCEFVKAESIKPFSGQGVEFIYRPTPDLSPGL